MSAVKKVLGFYILPLYILIHPFDGFRAMKFDREGRMWVAALNFLVVCISYSFSAQYTASIVTPHNPLVLNSLRDFSTLTSMLVLFCIANWSVTSLTDGEGKLKEIFMAVCYAMTPLVLTIIPATLLSNVLAYEETGFYFMLLSVGMGYFLFLAFIGLVTVHNYTATKAIITMFLTFVALVVIVFLLTMLSTLLFQVIMFIQSVYDEIIFRG
ncbi:MAG: YIP1 family protein [Defluviitaleaceae bacterium]|nr:YIP1 family protein [Defluviitaleaceae bacterium]